jgi:hypothetical protein
VRKSNSLRDIADSLDEGARKDVIIVDFSKDFDLVPHYWLLTKIASSGVDSMVVVWVRDFLLGRSQRLASATDKRAWKERQGSLAGSRGWKQRLATATRNSVRYQQFETSACSSGSQQRLAAAAGSSGCPQRLATTGNSNGWQQRVV